ncbi:MAG: 50S ribosomal protein L25 [Patescibacteria group bacterium]
MQKVEVQAHPRSTVGRASKTLRSQGILPAVLYGNNFKPLNIQIPMKEFGKVYAQAGESTLVYLKLNDQSYPTIIHDVTTDPVHDTFIHADFYKVRLDEKIKAKVPVVIVGESPAVKSLGGILVTNINEIEVEGFPQDLPHQFDVDISSLVLFRDHFQIKDLKVPANVEIKANAEEIIALIQEPISEEKLKESLETAPATSVEDVEMIKKEKKEEEVTDDTTPTEPADTKKE